MKVKEVMSYPAIQVRPEESVNVAARLLEHYNIGALPVCGTDGTLHGMVTDRDLAIRCLACGNSGENTRVQDVMTKQVMYVRPDMDAAAAARIMGRNQIRRLPVLENGKVCGVLSLGDLASREESSVDAGDALSEISSPVSSR